MGYEIPQKHYSESRQYSKNNWCIFIENQNINVEKLEEVGTRLEYSCHLLQHVAQETAVTKGTARTTKKLLKLWPYKTIVVHSLCPCDPEARLNFCNCDLQSVGIF
jgi:hypothetical protein